MQASGSWLAALGCALLPRLSLAAEDAPVLAVAMRYGGCEGPVPYVDSDDATEHARKLLRWREVRPEVFAATAIPDGMRFVADTEPKSELHLVFDDDREVRPALIAMLSAAAPHGTVVLHVRDAGERALAERWISVVGRPESRIAEVTPPEGIWLRDFAGHVATTPTGTVRVDFQYTLDCVVDDAWPVQLDKVVRSPLWLEGGSLLTDGERCYVSESVAEANALTLERAAAELRALGCQDTVWLLPMPDSILHVDPFLAIGDHDSDGRVALVLGQVDADLDPEMHEVLEENARRLAPHGEVLRISFPAGRPVAPQLNVLPFNGIVMVPDLGRGVDEATWSTLQSAWPTRKLVPIPSVGLAALDGGPHCVSATVPAAGGGRAGDWTGVASEPRPR